MQWIVACVVAGLIAGGCGGLPGLRSAAPPELAIPTARHLGPKTWSGQAYKQVEEGLTVVHLKGTGAQIRAQYHALLRDEISAAGDVLRRNRVFQGLVRGGCSNFAAFGPASRDGTVWHGRTFDFYGLGAMDRYRVISIVEPEGGIPFVSIGWADWSGESWTHTGMNAAGISLGYMWGNAVDEHIRDAPALWTLLHRVLARARSVRDAVRLLEDAPRASAANVLITDAKIPTAVVVELTSRALATRAAADGVIYATNHFVLPAMRQPIKDPNSEARFQRLGELLSAHRGRVGLRESAAFLRDHHDPLTGRKSFTGDVIAWNINVAAVVFSPTDRTFWVARGLAPAVYGEFVGFSLQDELAGSQASTRLPAVPRDPVTDTAGYRGFLAYQAGYVAALEGNYAVAVEKIREAIPSDPRSGRYRYALADAHLNLGRYPEATRAFQEALATDMNDVLRAYTHVKLGQIYERTGQTEKMRDAMSKVLELQTGEQEIEGYARRALGRPR